MENMCTVVDHHSFEVQHTCESVPGCEAKGKFLAERRAARLKKDPRRESANAQKDGELSMAASDHAPLRLTLSFA